MKTVLILVLLNLAVYSQNYGYVNKPSSSDSSGQLIFINKVGSWKISENIYKSDSSMSLVQRQGFSYMATPLNSIPYSVVGSDSHGYLYSYNKYYLFPSQSGNSGKVLGTNGTAISWVSNSASMAVASAMTSKSFNTAYQVSSAQDSRIWVSATITSTLSLAGGQDGSIILEVSPNGSTGWVFAGQIDGSNTGTLSVGLNTSQKTGAQMSSDIPIGYYWRLRTVDNTGTPTYTWKGGSYSLY